MTHLSNDDDEARQRGGSVRCSPDFALVTPRRRRRCGIGKVTTNVCI